MSYDPRPDSVAFRALAHMELLHKGSEITSGVLAVALGVDANGMAAQLAACVEHGLIFRRQKGGHLRSPVFWSLVDRSKKTNGNGYIEGQGSQHVLKAEAHVPDATDREPPAIASPSVGSMGAGKTADAAPDGELTLRQIIAKRGRIALTRRAHAPKPEVKKHTSTPPKLALDLRIALWSDGTLEIRRTPDDLVLFTADEARAIVDYLVAVEA